MKSITLVLALTLTPSLSHADVTMNFGNIEHQYYFDEDGEKCDINSPKYMEFGPEGLFYIQDGENFFSGAILGERPIHNKPGSEYAAQLDENFGTDILTLLSVNATGIIEIHTDDEVYTFENVKKCER